MSDNNKSDNNNFDPTAALTKVLTETLREQKKIRRYKTLGRGFSLAIFVLFLWVAFTATTSPLNDSLDITKPHTALIEIKGMISEDSFYGSAEHVISSLKKAFKQDNVQGIILDLNSPGGSPVQSDLIYQAIKKLQAEDKRQRKVYSVVSDVCASGCYYLASATDKIFANELSTVGSIGVLFSSFGAVELLKKIGVDRRLQTAGKYKAFLDPFSEETEEGKQLIQEHLKIVHQVFIDRVKVGRQGRLRENNPDLFTGLFWTGKQGLELGLVDEIGSKSEVASEVIGAENIVDYTTQPTLADLLSGNYSKFPMSLSTLKSGSRLVSELGSIS